MTPASTTALADLFTQTDPLDRSAGSPWVSAYSYAANNPAVYTDPSGERESRPVRVEVLSCQIADVGGVFISTGCGPRGSSVTVPGPLVPSSSKPDYSAIVAGCFRQAKTGEKGRRASYAKGTGECQAHHIIPVRDTRGSKGAYEDVRIGTRKIFGDLDIRDSELDRRFANYLGSPNNLAYIGKDCHEGIHRAAVASTYSEGLRENLGSAVFSGQGLAAERAAREARLALIKAP